MCYVCERLTAIREVHIFEDKVDSVLLQVADADNGFVWDLHDGLDEKG